MLLILAILLATASLTLLLANPAAGIILAFVVKPVVDTAWATDLVFGLQLTEIFSVMFSTIVLGHMFVRPPKGRGIMRMPMRAIWLVYLVDIFMFSLAAIYVEGPIDGLSIFFRHINGFVGFCAGQAYFGTREGFLRLLRAFMVAGLFPIGAGIVEALGLANFGWRQTIQEGMTRNIGFYHDAITVRYYAQQTIFSLLIYSTIALKRRVVLAAPIALYGVSALVVMFKAYSKSSMVTSFLWALQWTILRRKYMLLLVLGAIAVAGLLTYADMVAKELYTMFHKEIGAIAGTVGVERTFEGRWYIWEELATKWLAFNTLQQFFGSGHLAIGAHNDYFQILFHGGLVGLCLYLSLLAVTLARIVRCIKENKSIYGVAALMAITMWLIDSIGLVPSAYSGYQWFIWSVIGGCMRIHRDERANKERHRHKLGDETNRELSSEGGP